MYRQSLTIMKSKMKQVFDLVLEYEADPNCYPALWISDVKVDEYTKRMFILICEMAKIKK
jgi:hypothetical protein